MRTLRRTALIALACLTSLALATPAFAQTTQPQQPMAQQTNDQGIGIGALGGLTFTSAAGDDSAGIASGTGWMIGIWFGGNVNGAVGFMGELSYVRKRIQDETFPDDNYLETDYFEIPALIRINIGSRQREGVRGYGLIGPVFDIRLGSKLVDGGFEIPETELENQFSAVDIGLMAGAGIEWNRIGFEFRYSWGLTRLATDEALDAGNLPDVKSNTLQLIGKNPLQLRTLDL